MVGIPGCGRSAYTGWVYPGVHTRVGIPGCTYHGRYTTGCTSVGYTTGCTSVGYTSGCVGRLVYLRVCREVGVPQGVYRVYTSECVQGVYRSITLLVRI